MPEIAPASGDALRDRCGPLGYLAGEGYGLTPTDLFAADDFDFGFSGEML
jgi:hypothetical protein